MQKLEMGGVFENVSGIDNLWDEASWALIDGFDDAALEAAIATIEQFAAAEVQELLIEEISLHCYLLSQETGDDGLPPPDERAMIKEIANNMCDLAMSRDIDEVISD